MLFWLSTYWRIGIDWGPVCTCIYRAVMTILAIGTDYMYDDYRYGLADAIRLVRIDFTNPEVSTLDFPRDLWVEIPEIADHGVTHGKLNQGYAFGTPGIGFYDGPGGGAGLLARTMDLNFGARVDHYITINLQTLVDAVDAVGGVDIYFDHIADLNAVVGPEYPNLILTPGIHHVDGTLAKSLVRSRIPTTFQRANYQNMLISALRDKLMTPEMWPMVPGLVAR